MAYFPDLSPYAYGHRPHPGVLHIGWLDGVHEYPKGKVAEHVLGRLKRLATEPTELYRGFHICELCSPPEGLIGPGDAGYWDWAKPRSSNGEIRVTLGTAAYAAPVLIVHYIEEHGYLPPEEFLRAVMEAAPNPQGGANGRQPFSSETNRTSAAAASRRSP
jgi:hypothetical protein